MGLLLKNTVIYDEHIEEEMQKIRESWLNNRKGPQLCLLQIDIFRDTSA